MSKELVKTGQRMYELAAKLEAEQRAERTARPALLPVGLVAALRASCSCCPRRVSRMGLLRRA